MKRIVVLSFLAALACAAIGLIAANHLGIRAVSGQEGVPTVTTDKPDYASGETVEISGSGFAVDAEVTVRVTRPDASVVTGDGSGPWPTSYDTVVTDGEGGFQYYYVLNGILGEYLVEVLDGRWDDPLIGQAPVLASTTFTDSRTINSVTLDGGASVIVAPGASITAAVTVTTSGGGSSNDWESTSWRISTTPPGSVGCANTPNHTDPSGTYTESFTVTAPTTVGTYNAYFRAHNGDTCSTSGQSDLFTLNNAVVVQSPGPNLTAVKTNDAGGAVDVGGSFTWNVRVRNAGIAAASFSNGAVILTDDLPAGPTYGIPSVTTSGITGTVACVISSGTLTCTASGAVTMPVASFFDVFFDVTATAAGNLINPAASGVCRADPNNVVSESNEGDNDCSNTVVVSSNPELAASCGTDIALVIDGSGSVSESEYDQMQAAFVAFVQAFLPETPTEFALVEFAGLAVVRLNFTGNETTITNEINEPREEPGSQYTNWEQGLTYAHGLFPNRDNPDLVIFASDGNPNRIGNDVSVSESVAVAAAVTVANDIKDDGIRIITIGIGSDVDTANLIAISSADATYTSGFEDLAADLAALAVELCGGTISVHKVIDADGDLGTPGDQSDGVGWQFDASVENGTSTPAYGDTDSEGFIVFDIDIVDTTAIVDITETVEDGFTFISAGCTKDSQSVGTPSGTAVNGIGIGPQDIVSCTFYNTPEEREADVKKVSFAVLTPPTDIDVSDDVPVTVRAVLHNNGPDGPVDIQDVITATVPGDCTVTPVTYTEVINNVAANGDATVDGVFTIHCSEPSQHTFTFHDEVTVLTPQVEDPVPGNNVADTTLTVNAIAYADLEQTVTVPEVIPEAEVSEDATLHLTATIKNTGPYGPVSTHNRLTFWFPEDGEQGGCEVKLYFPDTGYTTDPLESGQTVDAPLHSLAVNESLGVAVDVIAHCYESGLFPWWGSAQVVVDSPHVVDPVLTNNGPPPDDPIGRDVPFIDYADVEDIAAFPDWASLSPPRLGIDNDDDTEVDEDWYDGVDNDNDTMVDEDLPDFNVSQDYSVNLVDLIRNNGPLTPVGVTLQIGGTVPAGVEFSYHCDGGERVEVDSTVIDPCPAGTTVWANPGQTFRVTLAVPPIPSGVPVPVVRKFDWHCLEPSQHVWNLNKEIWPSNEYTHDPYPDNNDGVVPVGINCIAKADAAIVAQWVVGPAEIPVGQDVPIFVMKTIHNIGPYWPVDLQTVKDVGTPLDCRVNLYQHVEQIHNVPVSVDVTHSEPFTIHCSTPSLHTFTFDNVISNKDPHILDLVSGNDRAHTDWTVPAIATANLEVVAQRTVVWPANIDVSEDVQVTLETDVRNNGPYGPVEARFEGWLVPPSQCTALPALVSQQVTLDTGETQTIQQQFTIHCSQKCLRTFTFWNRITAKDPHIREPNPDPGANQRSRVLPSVDSWALADVEIIDQYFVDPPAEIQVSADVDVTLRKVLQNTGPYTGPVTVTIDKTATAPDGCTIDPLSYSHDVVLPDNTAVTVEETFTIHCSEDGTYTFTVDNDVGGPHELHVRDPNMPNFESTDLEVLAIGKADVKIISQRFVDPPASINVSEHVPVTLEKVLHNNGPYAGPVEVTINKTAIAPTGCSISPPSGPQQVILPFDVPVPVTEVFTIHCEQPSRHTFTVGNVVSGPKDARIEDPDMTNNSESTTLTVDVLADVDVAVSQQVLNWPTDINVSQNKPITVRKTITATVQNQQPYNIPSVTVTVTKTASAPAGCTVTPTSGAVQKVVSTTTPLVFDEQFTIHCSEPSNHGPFVFRNVVGDPEDAHISDPNTGNNTAETTNLSVNALADVDVAVTQTIVSPPAEIDVSQDKVITLRKTITATVLNQQPYNIPSVAVTVTKTASAPAGCTVTPTSGVVQKVVLTTAPLVFDEQFTIHCAEPSTHGPFVFRNEVGDPKDPHISDPNAGNNTAQTPLTVDVIAYSDLEVAAQYVENPPAEIPVSGDVAIVLIKVLHNIGPWGPVDAQTETDVAAPQDCTVSPGTHIQRFWNLPVSVDILHHEPFTIHCAEPSEHTFVFDDEVHLTSGPHVRDLVPDNDALTTELTVAAVAEADIKIVSVGFVDPPDKLPMGENMDITLRKVVHNNGPWEPVDITIVAAASAPANCTVVPKNVPSSISAVLVSVDQVVDEVWTIQCTETGLKTFVFDNSLDSATAHVSDPDLSNNSSHKLLSVRDDPDPGLDADDDGLNDAVDPCPFNPDCDGDGVSDGLDNCPLVKNAAQADFDGDDIGDACDTSDSDADGFLDAVELYLATDPLAPCAGDPPQDSWPLDMNKDNLINLGGDVSKYAGRVGTTGGPPASPNWSKRLDLNMDNVINLGGDVSKYGGKIGRTCD